jgi:hypothetical protein
MSSGTPRCESRATRTRYPTDQLTHERYRTGPSRRSAYTAERSPSSRRSQAAMWFQLANIRGPQIPLRSSRRQRKNSRHELVEKRAGLHKHREVAASLDRDECLRWRPDGIDE